MNKLEKIILETEKGKYAGLYSKGTVFNNAAFVYFHGLNGKSKIVQPLHKKISEFDFFSMEQRGHENSYQKASISIKKHIQDIVNIVQYLKPKYKYIFLCGESMGAIYTAKYAFKIGDVDSVFCWSIPFYPKDIMKEKKSRKYFLRFRVLMCFLFGINYKYIAEIDYPRLTNSKFLLKLNEMNVKSLGSTSEEVAIWKASIGVKSKMKKKKPKCPLFYWQGDDDCFTNDKIFKKIKNNKNIYAETIKNSKHILMFEENSFLMFDKIVEIAKKKILN